VVVPHPVGDRDDALVQSRGVAIAGECVRALTTPADRLSQEYESKVFPLTSSLMPR
jgi:hypothetical protein